MMPGSPPAARQDDENLKKQGYRRVISGNHGDNSENSEKLPADSVAAGLL